MRRSLAFFATGAALSAATFILANWYLQSVGPEEQLVLAYQRNTGPEPWPLHEAKDPDANRESVTHYAVYVARRCKLKQWIADSNEGTTDVDSKARITMPTRTISDASFDCLASFIKPPYVTLSRVRF